jgi:hypothetical protein
MIHNILKLIIILFLNACINDLGQPFREAEHKIDKDKISRQDAKKQITGALALFYSSCPTNARSGLNPGLNWQILLAEKKCKQDTFPGISGLTDLTEGNEYFLNGCADYNYLSRKGIGICTLAILIMKCSNSSYLSKDAQDSYFSTFSLCNKVLKNEVYFPTFFF